MPGSGGEHSRTQALPTQARTDSRTDSRADSRADDDAVADERAESVPGQRGDRPSSGSNGERPAPAMRPARLAAADGRA
jgi:hypothetical protein